MNAKEYLLSIGIRTEEQDLLKVMEDYATLREQEAWNAAREMDTTMHIDFPKFETIEDWRKEK